MNLLWPFPAAHSASSSSIMSAIAFGGVMALFVARCNGSVDRGCGCGCGHGCIHRYVAAKHCVCLLVAGVLVLLFPMPGMLMLKLKLMIIMPDAVRWLPISISFGYIALAFCCFQLGCFLLLLLRHQQRLIYAYTCRLFICIYIYLAFFLIFFCCFKTCT